MAWTVLGESVTGTSHRARNTPCQDACRFRTSGAVQDWLIIAAADGAGSACHSEIGATLACDELLSRADTLGHEVLLTREGVATLFTDVRSVLIGEAERLNVRPRDVACTALLAMVGPTSAVFAQVGDGAIVVGQGDAYRVVFWPDPAEYANATDFLTDDGFAACLRVEMTTDSIGEVAALTDGLQRVALNFAIRTPYAPFFRPLFSELRSAADPQGLVEPLRKLLDSDRVNKRTDDDKTLVLAVRRP